MRWTSVASGTLLASAHQIQFPANCPLLLVSWRYSRYMQHACECFRSWNCIIRLFIKLICGLPMTNACFPRFRGDCFQCVQPETLLTKTKPPPTKVQWQTRQDMVSVNCRTMNLFLTCSLELRWFCCTISTDRDIAEVWSFLFQTEAVLSFRKKIPSKGASLECTASCAKRAWGWAVRQATSLLGSVVAPTWQRLLLKLS